MNIKETFCVVVEGNELYEPCYYTFADYSTMEAFKALAEGADFYVGAVEADFSTSASEAFASLRMVNQMCTEG